MVIAEASDKIEHRKHWMSFPIQKKILFVCSITAKILGQILTLDWTREILCTKNCFYRHPWKVDRISTCDTGICFINASKMYLKYSKCGIDVPKCINKQYRAIAWKSIYGRDQVSYLFASKNREFFLKLFEK